MNNLITLLALVVAILALYAYRRISVRADETIDHCRKAEFYYKAWRKRFSKRCHRMADEYVALKMQHDHELYRAGEREKVKDHYQEQANKLLNRQALFYELLNLVNKRYKSGLDRREQREITALRRQLSWELIDEGYLDLKKNAARRPRDWQATPCGKVSLMASGVSVNAGAEKCPSRT